MDRLHATGFWRLSRRYFEDLRRSLGDRLFLCVAEVGGEVAAASLLTEVDGIVEYHLTGTADAHRRASPSKLVINFATRWAKARGNRCFHLTGSLRKGDSLHEFKTGFSPIEHPVCSWRLVVDSAAYTMLVERWEAEHHSKADSPEEYFPAYRKLDSPVE
jgi:lipid II:glycine glycyltransferase (peptidoglycan interpeptide bridge formation enzyme)